MFAIEVSRYGKPEVLKRVELNYPTLDSHSMIIKVKATSATSGDYRIRSGHFPTGFGLLGKLLYGFKKPKIRILGSEISGIIVSVGEQVKNWQMNDEVIVQLGAKMGGYEEFVSVNPKVTPTVKKPKSLSFVEAATLSFGGTVAMKFLTEKNILKASDRVLVYGASGSVGTAMLQVAHNSRAHITAVSRIENKSLLLSLGANEVVDYRVPSTALDQKFDVIIDSAGFYSVLKNISKLKPSGKLLLPSATLPQSLLAIFVNLFTNYKVVSTFVELNQSRLEKLVELANEGKFLPVIDKVFPISEIQKAHHYLDLRNRSGNIGVEV